MESGNSGSFQSSTGDEEFDSHGDGISALVKNNQEQQQQASSSQVSSQVPPPCNRVSSYIYDHRMRPLPPPQALENNNPSSFLNSYVLDWSNAQRSENNPMLSSILASNQAHRHGSVASKSQPPSMAENTRVSIPEPPPTQETRKPRKRSRASRGATTTVLTTDTTNFRAMVQEFTGIPEPPFPSPHFQRSRLDIFGTVSGIRSDAPPPPPPYLQRPFPQKANLPSFLGSSTILDHAISSLNTNNPNLRVNDYVTTTTNALTSSFNNNYQFAPQNSTFFNLPNQFVNSSFLGTKHDQESDDLGDQTMLIRPSGLLPSLISDQRTSRNYTNQADVSWVNNGTGSSQDDDQSQVITSAPSNFSFSSS